MENKYPPSLGNPTSHVQISIPASNLPCISLQFLCRAVASALAPAPTSLATDKSTIVPPTIRDLLLLNPVACSCLPQLAEQMILTP